MNLTYNFNAGFHPMDNGCGMCIPFAFRRIHFLKRISDAHRHTGKLPIFGSPRLGDDEKTMQKQQQHHRSNLMVRQDKTSFGGEPRQFQNGGRLSRRHSVVVADDFAEHSIMLACAMRQTRSLQVVHTFSSDISAMQYLLGRGRYADRDKFPFPEVLITELGLPCLEMLKLLDAMGTEGFQTPLRIVLTGSPVPGHKEEAERLGADAFFRKPERFHGLVKIAHEIEQMLLHIEQREALLKLYGVKSA